MVRHHLGSGLLVALMFAPGWGGVASAAEPAPPAIAPDERLPVPDKLAVRKARQRLDEIYKDEYARERRGEAPPRLVDKLIMENETRPNDPVSSFAMLEAACDLAIDVGDPRRVERCAGLMAAKFKVDALELLSAGFERMAAKNQTSEAYQAIADAAQGPLASAVRGQRFEVASRLAEACAAAARKSQDATTLKRSLDVSARTAASRRAWEAKERAVAVLAQSPNDPVANLALGRYLCFVEGDLKGGIQHLAQGDNPSLKKLAKASMPAPTTADALNTLAGQWWAASEKAKGQDKTDLQFVAASYYLRALPGLTGLARLNAEQCVRQSRDRTRMLQQQLEPARAAEAQPQNRGVRVRLLPVIYADEFDDPQSGWGDAAVQIPDKPRWYGYQKGRYFISRPQPGVAWAGKPDLSAANFVCAATGRVVGADGSAWGLLLRSGDQRVAVAICVTNDQKVAIQPLSQPPNNPRIAAGSFAQPQLKKGDGFNTLAVALHDSKLEIFAEGQRVCEPLALPSVDVIRIQALVNSAKTSAVAELDRIGVFALPDDKAAAPEIARDLSLVGQ